MLQPADGGWGDKHIPQESLFIFSFREPTKNLLEKIKTESHGDS